MRPAAPFARPRPDSLDLALGRRGMFPQKVDNFCALRYHKTKNGGGFRHGRNFQTGQMDMASEKRHKPIRGFRLQILCGKHGGADPSRQRGYRLRRFGRQPERQKQNQQFGRRAPRRGRLPDPDRRIKKYSGKSQA